jgi:hypothetical protein
MRLIITAALAVCVSACSSFEQVTEVEATTATEQLSETQDQNTAPQVIYIP